jgi:phenylacetate-coenzyme A ligase PaaK-like adenylate-forming protein
MKNFFRDIFAPLDEAVFEKKALELYAFQYRHNTVYRQFSNLLDKSPGNVKSLYDIPFLPVEMFKWHQVVSAPPPYEAVFESSGTTGMIRSKHYVKDLSVYKTAFRKTFEMFYGPSSGYLILALLPSYLERDNSSLIYMMNDLIASARPGSGFYLHDTERLYRNLVQADSSGEKVLLFGVSFALWDFSVQYDFNLKNTIIMETGGMKGRKREPVRQELHGILSENFGVPVIHSEYGMTELLSQAYSRGEGKFKTPPWMKILIRDTEDPMSYLPENKTGGINIIDLANVYSCAFIATQDLGKQLPGGSFEVSGRFDNSDIRGCNLLIME